MLLALSLGHSENANCYALEQETPFEREVVASYSLQHLFARSGDALVIGVEKGSVYYTKYGVLGAFKGLF